MHHQQLLLLTGSSLAAGSIIQHPLHESTESQALINTKPLVSSQALQDDIGVAALLKRAKDFSKIADLSFDEYNHPTRVIGSEGHLATVDYIYSTIASLGDYYTIANQTFPATISDVFEYRLNLGNTTLESSLPMSLTPPTTNREPVFGPLVLVANEGCDPSDYPAETKGAIALIKRGTCAFGDKSVNAGKAGAITAVVYNNERGRLSGTLGPPVEDSVATFGISDTDAKPLIEALKNGETVEGSSYIDALLQTIGITNVIAQTKGGDQDNCVMLGGHSDSVDAGPGINDDGSGSISLLEVATQLAKYSVNNCVRFGWWAGEEEGLLGSDWYVSQLSEEENLKIRLFMDYDMMASPNYAYQVYNANNKANPVGSEELRILYTDWYAAQGLNFTYIPFDGRSDYDAFIKNGIPGGGIATGAEGVKSKAEEEMFGGTAGHWYDPCYHQICDTIENLALEVFEINTKLIAHSVATYAVSFDGFPKRTGTKSNAIAHEPRSLYHGGSKLIM